MADKAYLILEDGSVFQGVSFGSKTLGSGEVVFNTSMTGYQEVLTDPSYAGQIVNLTYPIVGNYGINENDMESSRIRVSGLIVREHCEEPSHLASQRTLNQFLIDYNVPGISGVDTRAVTRRLRSAGVMMGMITTDEPESALRILETTPRYDNLDLVDGVSTTQIYDWTVPSLNPDIPIPRVLVTDSGLKYNILRHLRKRNCEVIVLPAATSSEEMMELKPSGILVSPGPGDPQLLDYVVRNLKEVIGKVPMMGICLGHQLIARALGASTFKLKFGHRGGNHPVKDLQTGKVYITSQNHGYSVNADGLPNGLEISHVNLNDGTVEGLQQEELQLFTIQYHSEAAPGPQDNEYLFDKFVGLVNQNNP